MHRDKLKNEKRLLDLYHFHYFLVYFSRSLILVLMVLWTKFVLFILGARPPEAFRGALLGF